MARITLQFDKKDVFNREGKHSFTTGKCNVKLFDNDGACCVLAIQPNSQADKAEDIAKGDMIVAINDTDVDDKPTTEINKWWDKNERTIFQRKWEWRSTNNQKWTCGPISI